MPNELFLGDNIDRELSALEIHLTAKASLTAVTLAEFIETSLISGVSPDVLRQQLLTDLEQGGRIFGQFRNSVRATASGNLTRVRNISSTSEVGVDVPYRWVAVLVKTCDDCLDRHGQVATWEEWEARGLPGAGQTVCREYCHCTLLPAETVDIEPIKRGK